MEIGDGDGVARYYVIRNQVLGQCVVGIRMVNSVRLAGDLHDP